MLCLMSCLACLGNSVSALSTPAEATLWQPFANCFTPDALHDNQTLNEVWVYAQVLDLARLLRPLSGSHSADCFTPVALKFTQAHDIVQICKTGSC